MHKIERVAVKYSWACLDGGLRIRTQSIAFHFESLLYISLHIYISKV